MRVRDIMTTKVITVTSNTTISKADEVMATNNISRLPVVDNGKLVGIVSVKRIMNATVPQKTPTAIWKYPFHFFGMKVKEIMIRDVVTVTPDMTVEGAAFIAQEKKVGGTPVVEDNRVVGIVTSNDYHYNILNPLMGVRQARHRLVVKEPGSVKGIRGVFDCLDKNNAVIFAINYINVEKKGIESELIISLETMIEAQVAKELKDMGYNVEVR